MRPTPALALLFALAYVARGAVSDYVGPRHPPESWLAYGGILSGYSVPAVLDTDFLRAIHFGLNRAYEFGGSSVARHLRHDPFIYAPRALELKYSTNGRTQLEVERYVNSGGVRKSVRRRMTMGWTYHFHAVWDCGASAVAVHTIAVTRDNVGRLAVLEHTAQSLSRSLSVSLDYDGATLSALSCLGATNTSDAQLRSIRGGGSCPSAASHSLAVVPNPMCDIGRFGLGRGLRISSDAHSDHHGSGAGLQSSAPRVFRALTYNVWNYNGKPSDYYRRVRMIGAVCRSARADVIAFQEVRYDVSQGGSLGPSQTDHLVGQLPGYQYVFQPAMSYPEGDATLRVEEGLAVFSRHPIVSRDYILLPRDSGDDADVHQRILLHAVLDTGDTGKVHVFVSHFSLKEESRERGAAVIAAHMRAVAPQNEPWLFMGDLNALPHTDTMRFFDGAISLQGTSMAGQLRDVWTMLHPEPEPPVNHKDPLETQDRRAGLTFSTLDPLLAKRIDYVYFHSPKGTRDTCRWEWRPVECATVGDVARAGVHPSDHLGVLSAFTVRAVDSCDAV